MGAESQHRAKIPTYQGVIREAIRDIGHPLAFRAETQEISLSGLAKARRMLDQKIGVVLVEPHFAGIDPLWVANDITRKHGYRSIPISGPIRHDRLIPGLQTAARFAGFELVKVVTPDAFRDLIKDKNLSKDERRKRMEEFKKWTEDYHRSSADTLNKGGIVVVAQSAHRQPYLMEPGDFGAVSELVKAMIEADVPDFGIHFTACEIPGTEDYSKARGYNFGKRYVVRHGNTFFASELLALTENPDLSKKEDMRRIDRFAHKELSKIVPEAYLPKPEAVVNPINTVSADIETLRDMRNPQTAEEIISSLSSQFPEIDPEVIAKMVNEKYERARVNHGLIGSFVKRELQGMRDASKIESQPPTLK